MDNKIVLQRIPLGGNGELGPFIANGKQYFVGQMIGPAGIHTPVQWLVFPGLFQQTGEVNGIFFKRQFIALFQLAPMENRRRLL